MRHNNCAIFSVFLYFKYSFLSNSFIYKFVLAIILLFIERKAISCLSVELPKISQYWSCLIIYSTVAYKRVAYKKILCIDGSFEDLEFNSNWKSVPPCSTKWRPLKFFCEIPQKSSFNGQCSWRRSIISGNWNPFEKLWKILLISS